MGRGMEWNGVEKERKGHGRKVEGDALWEVKEGVLLCCQHRELVVVWLV